MNRTASIMKKSVLLARLIRINLIKNAKIMILNMNVDFQKRQGLNVSPQKQCNGFRPHNAEIN